MKVIKMNILKPKKLQKGDQIGLVSPAGPVNKSELKAGIDILKSAGFRVRLAPHVYDKKGYLAGSDDNRLKDLHDMLQDNEIDAVFCTRGGYGSLRLLENIRYDLMKTSPKIIVGYSDITALLMASYVKTGLITFHGPMVRGLNNNKCKNWEHLLRLISSTQPTTIGLDKCSILAQGAASGPLIGGNLSLICHLLGTPFFPSLDGCILFIEDRGEPLYRLDRMLTYLGLSGRLEKVSGLIAGQFDECGDVEARNELLADFFSGYEFPVITDFPIGHGQENHALPVGLTADLDTKLMTLTFEEACV